MLLRGYKYIATPNNPKNNWNINFNIGLILYYEKILYIAQNWILWTLILEKTWFPKIWFLCLFKSLRFELFIIALKLSTFQFGNYVFFVKKITVAPKFLLFLYSLRERTNIWESDISGLQNYFN